MAARFLTMKCVLRREENYTKSCCLWAEVRNVSLACCIQYYQIDTLLFSHFRKVKILNLYWLQSFVNFEKLWRWCKVFSLINAEIIKGSPDRSQRIANFILLWVLQVENSSQWRNINTEIWLSLPPVIVKMLHQLYTTLSVELLSF